MNYVKTIVNNWDPIGLMCHAPNDEYNAEIEEIIDLLTRTNDLSELAYGIYCIFIESFGTDVFNKSESECRSIARLLVSNQR